jgi:hypothetical protein
MQSGLRKLRSILIFVLATAIFFAVVAYTFRSVDFQSLFADASTSSVLALLGWGLGFHLSFGVVMWVAFWLHYRLKLAMIEILTLPLMMHLFLYLMPLKGGMLFQVFYSKQKYKLDLSKGFSLGMMVFLNSLILTIFLGLAMVYLLPIDSLELKTVIWCMGLSLVGFVVALNLLPKQGLAGDGIVRRGLNFLINVRIQLTDQFKNVKLFFGLLITTFVSVIIQAILFWKTGSFIGVESDFGPVLLVVLILRIILLIRLLPGNLGIQEVMIGVVFATAGFEIEDGLMIGIITRLISVFWSATIGLPALYSNLKYFESASLNGLIKSVAKAKE